MSDLSVMVYHYRANGAPAMRYRFATISRDQLQQILDTRHDLQATTKYIPRGTMNIDIYQHDLLTEEQKRAWFALPNYNQNVASVTLSARDWIHFTLSASPVEIVILSQNRGHP